MTNSGDNPQKRFAKLDKPFLILTVSVLSTIVLYSIMLHVVGRFTVELAMAPFTLIILVLLMFIVYHVTRFRNWVYKNRLELIIALLVIFFISLCFPESILSRDVTFLVKGLCLGGVFGVIVGFLEARGIIAIKSIEALLCASAVLIAPQLLQRSGVLSLIAVGLLVYAGFIVTRVVVKIIKSMPKNEASIIEIIGIIIAVAALILQIVQTTSVAS